jgi:hypothetical protein
MAGDRYRLAAALAVAQRCEARAEELLNDDDRRLLRDASDLIRGLALRAAGIVKPPASPANSNTWQRRPAGESRQED